jgi:hypothetical protein
MTRLLFRLLITLPSRGCTVRPHQHTKGEVIMANTSSKTRKNSQTAQAPVARIRLGLLTASIWERVQLNGTFYSVTIDRRYRDSKGEWHTTHSFDKANLLTLAKLVDLADTEIIKRLAAHREQAAA